MDKFIHVKIIDKLEKMKLSLRRTIFVISSYKTIFVISSYKTINAMQN